MQGRRLLWKAFRRNSSSCRSCVSSALICHHPAAFHHSIVRMLEKPVTSKTSMTAGFTFLIVIVPCLFMTF